MGKIHERFKRGTAYDLMNRASQDATCDDVARMALLAKDLKGKKDGNCNRAACQQPGAYYFNRGTGAYYCWDCARDIDQHAWANGMHDLFPNLRPDPREFPDSALVELAAVTDRAREFANKAGIPQTVFRSPCHGPRWRHIHTLAAVLRTAELHVSVLPDNYFL